MMTVNGRQYTVRRLLGKGKGGCSYLVTDGAGDYERLWNIGIPMPKLLDVDETQERILKEYIPGDTIDKMVKEDRMEDGFFWQMEDMCRLLYPANTNIDYFLTNFVVCGGKIYYIDLACNDYME